MEKTKKESEWTVTAKACRVLRAIVFPLFKWNSHNKPTLNNDEMFACPVCQGRERNQNNTYNHTCEDERKREKEEEEEEGGEKAKSIKTS